MPLLFYTKYVDQFFIKMYNNQVIMAKFLEVNMIQEIRNQIKFSKNSLSFLVSGICCSLLLWHFPGMSVIFCVGALLVTIALSLFVDNISCVYKDKQLSMRILYIICAIVISHCLSKQFIKDWLLFDKPEEIIVTTNLLDLVLRYILAGVVILSAVYFLTLVISLLFNELEKVLTDTIKVTEQKSVITNIKGNIFFIISAFCFMLMHIQRYNIVIFLLLYILIVIISSQITGISQKIKVAPLGIKIYSFISSIGICYHARLLFCSVPKIYNISEIQTRVIKYFSAPVAVLSVFAIFVLVTLLLNYVFEKVKGIFRPLTKIEIILYVLLIVALFAFTCYAFFGSFAFWDRVSRCDLIYTGDSPYLGETNVYLELYHGHNDLRQPLFAVFAAPFVGFGYTLALPFAYFSFVYVALFMNAIQIILLVVAGLMLAKIMKLNVVNRISFIFILFTTYTTLLFTIMMEQYIISYFWVIFMIYSYVEYKKAGVVELSAAGGTVLTSLVWFPVLIDNTVTNSADKLKAYISDIEKKVVGFLIFFIGFGRLDVLLNAFSSFGYLSSFAGGGNIIERINQYISFVSSCFIAPASVVDTTTFTDISWQLNRINMTQTNLLGVILILLCFVSFILNRKNVLTKISAFWVCFSILLLCIVGWGSPENGMILYSLYFSWAFYVLLFQLLLWCSEKLKFKSVTPIVSSVVIAILAVYNYQGIRDLLLFAFKYYPFN